MHRSLVIELPAEGVHDSAEQRFTNRNLDDSTGASDFIAFPDVEEITQDDRADAVFLQVESQAKNFPGKLE